MSGRYPAKRWEDLTRAFGTYPFATPAEGCLYLRADQDIKVVRDLLGQNYFGTGDYCEAAGEERQPISSTSVGLPSLTS
jgi:hypothetical protein